MHPGYFPVFFWSLLILVSFWGYGELLRRKINRPEFADIGWGLTTAWGMSVVLAIGGVLMAFHLAKAPMLTLLILVGSLSAGFLLAKRFTAFKKPRSKGNKQPGKAPIHTHVWPMLVFCGFLWLLAALHFASSIAWPHQIDPNDDLVCYLMLPEKILHTGTLIEPFNFRRAGTLGGHAFLQALVMVVGGDRSGHVVDIGLGRLILFGVVLGLVPGRGRWPLIQRLTLGFLALTYPVPRINTMSACTGSVLLLALMQTLATEGNAKSRGTLSWLPSWLLCAACTTLRPQFGLAAGLIFGAGWAAACLKDKPMNSAAWVRGLPMLLPPLVLALPWMLVLFHSNDTLFMPPWLGNVNPAFLTTANPNVQGILGVVLRFFGRWELIPLLLCSALVVLSRRPLLDGAFICASLLCALAVATKMSATAPVEMLRYLVPLLLPAALYAVCATSWTRRISAVSGIMVCVTAIAANAQVAWMETKLSVVGLPEQMRLQAPLHPDDPNRPGTYATQLRALQEKIPPGRKILAVVDFPYLLDFSRNDIACIDTIGAAGPRGGVPLLQGADVLNRYLHDLGIEYVILMDFERALLLYNRNYWKNHPRPEWYYKKVWVPRFLDFMESMDDLWLIGSPLGSFYNLRVLQLPPAP